jgi:Flp pilus assembly protein TadD
LANAGLLRFARNDELLTRWCAQLAVNPLARNLSARFSAASGKDMMRGLIHIGAACALVLSASAAAAQGSYSPYDETPATALARYIHTLADSPQDFEALIGAGRSALEIGDTQAAAGFFARADDVNPRSPLPQAGMAAVAVANGEPQAALPYFKRAQQLGASPASFACDRGLAYDLMGQQAQAQSDYRLALTGADSDEARRRMALSLAIGGDRNGALQALAPLSAKGDSNVARVRAFVLALSGDTGSAMSMINAAMPSSSAPLAPFMQRLASLTPGQKAAAVNLGIFPDSGTPNSAYAAPLRSIASSGGATADRLADIDQLLRAPTRSAPSVQAAYSAPPRSSYAARPAAGVTTQPKLWLQLASGADIDALSDRFRRLKSHNPDVFKGIKPYVARSGEGARLVIGPFRGASDAEIFSEDLESIGVAPTKWTNSQSDRIAPLAVE